MIDGGLVLEGGSLRSMFSAGVLDILVENNMEFSYVNGVSAGTMAGMNYISKQTGRMLQINREYLHDKRYLGFRHLLRDRAMIQFDFIFGELSTELLPYDYQAFFQSPQRFEVVATRCKTGKPEFFEKGACKEIISAVQASSSMPLLCKMVTVDHKKYLDGGISLPIAYQRAMDLGYRKVVLILTRESGYQKKPDGALKRRAYQRYFEPLPELLESINEISDRYNRMQREIEQLEADGKIFVIRPEFPVLVSRLEQNFRKLEALYQEGRRVGEKRLDALRAYLE